jgi:Mg2+/Co2+ transporter CorC
MYEVAFTKEQLDLIGECVLHTIGDLRRVTEQIPIARVKFDDTIAELNKILTTLAEVSHENE